MSDETIVYSPPYPSTAANSRGLYAVLDRLRNWIIYEQNQLRDNIPARRAAVFREPEELDTEIRWEQVSVVDKNTILMTLRRIREMHDHISREHEDSWESRLCLQRRWTVLIMAQSILAEAFTDPEKREAQQEAQTQKASRELDILNKHLRDVLIPPELRTQDQVELPPDDNDDWFTQSSNSES